jgi:heme-degrading monooxygenase HmoA
MYARVTTIVFGKEEEVDAGALYRQVLPTVQALDGFKGMLVLSGDEDHSLLALTLWQSAACLTAAEPVLETVKQAETAYRQVETKQTARYAVAGSRLGL